MDRKQQGHQWYVAAAFMGLVLVQSWQSQASVTQRIPNSAVLDHLEAGQIAWVNFRPEQIDGRYVDPVEGNTHFITGIVPPDLNRARFAEGSNS
jgi:hypothetical protein